MTECVTEWCNRPASSRFPKLGVCRGCGERLYRNGTVTPKKRRAGLLRDPVIDERSVCAWVPLADGGWARISLRDIPVVSEYYWAVHHGHTTDYAKAVVGDTTIFMHRLLMQPPAGLVVDHRNHNGLDNRRMNLRNVTYAENQANRADRAA